MDAANSIRKCNEDKILLNDGQNKTNIEWFLLFDTNTASHTTIEIEMTSLGRRLAVN